MIGVSFVWLVSMEGRENGFHSRRENMRTIKEEIRNPTVVNHDHDGITCVEKVDIKRWTWMDKRRATRFMFWLPHSDRSSPPSVSTTLIVCSLIISSTTTVSLIISSLIVRLHRIGNFFSLLVDDRLNFFEDAIDC